MLDFPGMLWYHNIRPRDKDKNKTRNERNDLKILDELRKISKKREFVKDKKFDDADINITRIEGIIGFRFNGLGFYKQDIVMESIDEKTEEDSISTEDFIEKNKNGIDLSDDSATTRMGIKQIGYLDLSKIKDGTKKRLVFANLGTTENQK